MKPSIIYPKSKPERALLVDLDSRIQAGGKVAYNTAIDLRQLSAGQITLDESGRKVAFPRMLLTLDAVRKEDKNWATAHLSSRCLDAESAAILLSLTEARRDIDIEIRGGEVVGKVRRRQGKLNSILFLAAWCWPVWQRAGRTMSQRYKAAKAWGYDRGEKSFAEMCRKHGLRIRGPHQRGYSK